MRHSAAPAIVEADRRQFAEDVEYYLSLVPRQLPSRYLYDDLGSALFEAICHLPWYRITRTELRLLTRHAREIVTRVAPLSTLVELGPGTGGKLATLVEALHTPHAVTVHLVDVSPAALDAARRTLEVHAGLTIVVHQAEYETGLADAAGATRSGGKALALFLGSNIGNFDPPGAGSLLLGADLVKPERELRLAYDDPLGVTAAFNRNLLVRVNRELGADFDVDGFVHRAVWNAAASRIEMHLESTRRQHVTIPASHLDITFEAGESIWTESSYKYETAGVAAMLERAGFDTAAQWVEDDFALTLAAAV
jgi:L-histidine N-alpha-methyltransferase